MATRGGAEILGRKDIGSLEIGKQADCFMIDTRKLELVGAMEDAKSMLATVGYKQPVDYTIVAGKITVSEGKLTALEEGRLIEEANQVSKNYVCN